jgi:hypothetical protein
MYVVRATVTDVSGNVVTSDVTLDVVPTASFATMTPPGLTLYPGSQQQFTASEYDQFGNLMASQPSFNWTTTGSANVVSPSGLFTTGTTGGTFKITATSGAIGAEALVTIVSANVVGRRVFYNNSFFDGADPAANAGDDDAIAPDKSALLPGQAATFSNYTSYNKGINGVLIDVAGLPNAANLSAADFTFRAGTSATPGDWPAALAPTTVLMRLGAGAGGSDRIELIWADGAIVNEWLQITLNANAITGLAAPDVFYFGNLVGDTGNNPAAAAVTIADIAATRAANNQVAPIDSPFDFNRSGQITIADLAIVNSSNSLVLPLFPLAPAPVPRSADPMVMNVAASLFSTVPLAASSSDVLVRVKRDVLRYHA